MPRIGNQEMANYITAQAPERGNNYRMVHSGDSIPALPPQFLNYRHYGPEYVIHSGDDEYPKITDIERIEADQDGDGADTSTINWSISGSINAHASYFGRISKCYDDKNWNGLLPPNRMVVTNATMIW